MRVHVDLGRCEGHAQCEMAAPELFELGDDEQAKVIAEYSEDLRTAVTRAINMCPTAAISLQG